ncbi:TPA: hypothetical protein N0F65_008952 [Lagenidium giganteum]|uniref:Transmembrane protein n=1 Tax=Lagenidium giganteum TaxID=4803 RepID=A0AAV2YUB0_9STRA|nr:TPA: hypothetical protein N0F65_008952 [Lagenidium giganteum]
MINEATALFDDAWRVQEAAGREPGCEKRRIVLKGIAPRQKRSAAIVPARIALLVVAKHLVMDLCCVWSAENGNLGLDGFWSSRLFAFVALGFPVLFVAIVVPYAVSHDLAGWLSSLACAYAALWISLALVSILLLTTRLPLFREVRQVTDINLTDSLDCWRNHLVLMNLILEFCQLNTTSLSVWKGMYKPELFVSAVATVDVSNFGVDVTGSVDLFEIRQRVAVAGLVLWWFVLKASNKFRGIPFVNNIVTFVLPNLLSGPLLMSLAKQFYAEMACGESGVPGQYLLRADLRMVCWKREHLYIAFPSLIGMSSFVPIATLAFGSSQVFFPQLNVDLLTAPLINVASQIVKAFMVGALVFFVSHVRLYLGVALFGNLLLFGIVYQLQACCSVWYLRYIKLFVYAASSWSALCALGSTFVPDDVQASVPSCGLHGGWAALLLLFIGVAWRNRPNKAKPVTQKDRQSQTCELKGPPKSIFTTT